MVRFNTICIALLLFVSHYAIPMQVPFCVENQQALPITIFIASGYHYNKEDKTADFINTPHIILEPSAKHTFYLNANIEHHTLYKRNTKKQLYKVIPIDPRKTNEHIFRTVLYKKT